MADSYCTYFDSHYLPRGLAMYESLQRWVPGAVLHVLALDQDCGDRLRALGHSTLVVWDLADLESADPELHATKTSRNMTEYYYTCGPAFVLRVLQQCSSLSLLTYVDADAYFCGDPSSVIDELADSSVGLTVHRFDATFPQGRYNVGWISVRCDTVGLACAALWRTQCLEWCYERIEDDRYADQKYLESWPARFDNVKVIRHRGVNVAPWNVRDYCVWLDGDVVRCDRDPLVLFHFAGVRQIRPWLFNTNLGVTYRWPPRVLLRHVFGPYLAALRRHSRDGRPTGSIRKVRLRHPILQAVRDVVRTVLGVVFHQYVFVIRGRLL